MPKHCCEKMASYLQNEDRIILYWEKTGQYLIPVHDGGNSGIIIAFCPWCGESLHAE